WSDVRGIAAVLDNSMPLPARTPIVFKSVGCAAWDLAACRVAREALAGG
ncbi:MAG: delta(1)-pyrroline-2-carboxylate reductase family protein, partial [Paraburkholderia caledonica]